MAMVQPNQVLGHCKYNSILGTKFVLFGVVAKNKIYEKRIETSKIPNGFCKRYPYINVKYVMGALALCGCKNSVHPISASVDQIRIGIMACESCAVRFSILKHKKRCHECRKYFCSACVRKDEVRRCRFCQTCSILTKVPLERSELMKLRVRELRHFLNAKEIPSQMCTEKKELVDLILENFNPNRENVERTAFPASAINQNPNRSSSSSSSPMSTTSSLNSVLDDHPVNSEGPRTEATSSPLSYIAHAYPPEDEKMEEDSEQPEIPKLTIEDILDIDPEHLSIRQLKEVLARSFVTYKGCCEKYELLDRVKRLQEEVRENKKRVMQGLPEETTCKICMDAPIDCVLLECGHMVTCTNCGKLMNECPVCRQYVIRVVRTFRA